MSWNQPEPGFPQDADKWFTPGRFAALLAVLVGAAYPEVLFGQGTFFHRDFAVSGYPLAYYHRESFWRGELPLWNPLSHCGVPFRAQWNTLTLSRWSAPLSSGQSPGPAGKFKAAPSRFQPPAKGV